MKQDLPSYIANDAAPLFPDLSAMSDEEFNNYKSPPERLAFYRLHTEEGLKAFLYDVYWIGYPGLFIAVNHVWNLLIPPRAYHCTLMGQMSGAGGSGKRALVNTLKQFIGEALAIESPKAEAGGVGKPRGVAQRLDGGDEGRGVRAPAAHRQICRHPQRRADRASIFQMR